MTLGEVVALRKLLESLVGDRASSAELIHMAKDEFVLRVLRRLRAMESRGRALAAGAAPPGPIKASRPMHGREPALLPEASDAQ